MQNCTGLVCRWFRLGVTVVIPHYHRAAQAQPPRRLPKFKFKLLHQASPFGLTQQLMPTPQGRRPFPYSEGSLVYRARADSEAIGRDPYGLPPVTVQQVQGLVQSLVSTKHESRQ